MKITLNKNRGWRGMASAIIDTDDEITTIYFTFSPRTWEDLIINHKFVYLSKDSNEYIICTLLSHDRLPHPNQQRSVLIKDVTINITIDRMSTDLYNEFDLGIATSAPTYADYAAIKHFTANNNYHTKSEFNNVGTRVTPYNDFIV